MVRPRDGYPRRVQSRAQTVQRGRSVETVSELVAARPYDLDGRARHFLRDVRGLAHVVVVEPPAEPSAGPQHVHDDRLLPRLLGKTADRARVAPRVVRVLRRRPELADT